MAFKASFKFSDSREFDVLTWRVNPLAELI